LIGLFSSVLTLRSGNVVEPARQNISNADHWWPRPLQVSIRPSCRLCL